MTVQRMGLLLGPIGLAILVLLVVGFAVLGGNNGPGENASGQKVIAYWNAHQGIGWAQIPVIGVGLVLLVVFVTFLRHIFNASAAQSSPWPTVVFAAGVIFVADLVTLGGLNHIPLLLAAHNHQASI